jgi:hypothetical protein
MGLASSNFMRVKEIVAVTMVLGGQLGAMFVGGQECEDRLVGESKRRASGVIEGCALAETARLHWRVLRGRGGGEAGGKS